MFRSHHSRNKHRAPPMDQCIKNMVLETLIAKNTVVNKMETKQVTLFGDSQSITLQFDDFERLLKMAAKCEKLEERIAKLEKGNEGEGELPPVYEPPKLETK